MKDIAYQNGKRPTEPVNKSIVSPSSQQEWEVPMKKKIIGNRE